jgi:hypothetical protein
MERLLRLREPAAVVVVVALGLHLVLTVVGSTLSQAPGGLTDPVLLILLTVLVIACWVAEPTRHARGVTIAGLVLAVLALGAAVVFVVAALRYLPAATSPLLSVSASVLPSLIAGIVALGATTALLRRPRPAPAPPPELESAELAPEPVDPQQQPTWTSDAAVGTVWRRAGDAGSERPATRWDAPAATGGWWGSDPEADGPADTTRRTTD